MKNRRFFIFLFMCAKMRGGNFAKKRPFREVGV